MAIDPAEFEEAALKKLAEKKRQQESNGDIRAAIDPGSGKVRVWVFVEAKWKMLWPIDAKEQVRSGHAALSVTEMLDPKGATVLVDSQRVDALREEGWRLPGEKPPEQPPEDITKATVEQLREVAAKYEIEGTDAMKKAELVEAIRKAMGQ